MAWVYEELKQQLDKYFENKTKDELLQDLIDADCLKFFVDQNHTREYEYTYGQVSFYSNEGYGFIISEKGEKYFVFWKDIDIKGFKSLNKGEKVKFKIREGKNAYDVAVLPDDFVMKFEVQDIEY